VGFCSLPYAAQETVLSKHALQCLANEQGWETVTSGRYTFFMLADLATVVEKMRGQKLDGYISVREARRRLGVSRSMIYTLSRRCGWQRILTPERDLYFLETDVMAAFEERGGLPKRSAPEPEEIIVSQAPAGYSGVEAIVQQYQVDCSTVYQAADRHYWRRARAGNRVFFNNEDVQSYFEPEQARGYSLAEAATYLSIRLEQAALAAWINGWRRMPGNRFRASDVERKGAAQGVEGYLTLAEAAVRLGIRRAHLVKAWHDRKWGINYMRIGEYKAVFVSRKDVEQYARENNCDRYVADYYTTKDIRQALQVSRQRVGQLAEIYGWRRFYPSSRHVLYLCADVDAYLAKRQELA
jgi:hypothetical protein